MSVVSDARDLFEKCAAACDNCAEQVSAVTPDRRVLIYCKNAAERCREVMDAISYDTQNWRETLLACSRACERCNEACLDSIFPCAHECGGLCMRIAHWCHEMARLGTEAAA
jgi:hypothetical protein